jgi:hypothetical protein
MTRMNTIEEAHVCVPTKVMQISLKDNDKFKCKRSGKTPKPLLKLPQSSEASGLLNHEQEMNP